MRKHYLVPVLVAPPVAILLAVLIVGIFAAVYSMRQPLEINQAGLLLLLTVLPTIGLALAYGVTALVVLPVFRMAVRRGVPGLKVLLVLAVIFPSMGFIGMVLAGAPRLMAFAYGAGLFLPCSIGGALTFWFIYLRLCPHTPRHKGSAAQGVSPHIVADCK